MSFSEVSLSKYTEKDIIEAFRKKLENSGNQSISFLIVMSNLSLKIKQSSDTS